KTWMGMIPADHLEFGIVFLHRLMDAVPRFLGERDVGAALSRGASSHTTLHVNVKSGVVFANFSGERPADLRIERFFGVRDYLGVSAAFHSDAKEDLFVRRSRESAPNCLLLPDPLARFQLLGFGGCGPFLLAQRIFGDWHRRVGRSFVFWFLL